MTEFNQVKSKTGYTIDDGETLKTIERVEKKRLWLRFRSLTWSAVGICSLEKKYLTEKRRKYFLETAHPVKFPDSVEKQLENQ